MVARVSKSGTQPRAGKPKTATPASKTRTEPVKSNLDTLNEWVATFAPEASERLAVDIRTARELASWIDTGEWSAPDIREFRLTVAGLTAALAEEGAEDGQGAVVLSLSTPVRDTA